MSEEMTREQARDTLRNAAWLGTNEDRERIERAVELLCGEPSDDTVNRKAVLDIINFEDKWLFDAKGHNANTRIAFGGMRSKISALPSVTPKYTEITLESAIDYLNSIGWMQEHDRILTESAQSVTSKPKEMKK